MNGGSPFEEENGLAFIDMLMAWGREHKRGSEGVGNRS